MMLKNTNIVSLCSILVIFLLPHFIWTRDDADDDVRQRASAFTKISFRVSLLLFRFIIIISFFFALDGYVPLIIPKMLREEKKTVLIFYFK